jgi:hypothetical protein
MAMTSKREPYLGLSADDAREAAAEREAAGD